jgi:hypothetical protein
MAIRLVKPIGKDTRRIDAVALGLRVERNGERYQYFTLAATGQQLHLDHDIVLDHKFRSAAASVGAEQLREELARVVVPLDDPRQAIDLALDVERVARRLESGVELPKFVEDQIIETWIE